MFLNRGKALMQNASGDSHFYDMSLAYFYLMTCVILIDCETIFVS